MFCFFSSTLSVNVAVNSEKNPTKNQASNFGNLRRNFKVETVFLPGLKIWKIAYAIKSQATKPEWYECIITSEYNEPYFSLLIFFQNFLLAEKTYSRRKYKAEFEICIYLILQIGHAQQENKLCNWLSNLFILVRALKCFFCTNKFCPLKAKLLYLYQLYNCLSPLHN